MLLRHHYQEDQHGMQEECCCERVEAVRRLLLLLLLLLLQPLREAAATISEANASAAFVDILRRRRMVKANVIGRQKVRKTNKPAAFFVKRSS